MKKRQNAKRQGNTLNGNIVTSMDLKHKLESLGISLSSRFAVAVSGGADSLALALLMHKICNIETVTVDHGLRAESHAEAEFVQGVMTRHGIEHTILKWQGDKPEKAIQAAAREARYSLMGSWCRERKITMLVLGHHMDDQAETFLMRLSRGSGVYGLAAMAAVSPLHAGDGRITIVRPFLDFSKDDLKATLKAMGETWVEDPSNADRRYDRIKVREYLHGTPLLSIDAMKLSQTATRMQRAREALDFYTSQLLENTVKIYDTGYAELDAKGLCKAPDEIALRALARLVKYISGSAYSPRFQKLERAYTALRSDDFKGQTLFGCQVIPSSQGLIITRELAAVSPDVWTDEALWDGRFRLEQAREGNIKTLGEEGWLQLKPHVVNSANMSIPFCARCALPALWRGNRVLAQPHLQFGQGLLARFEPICDL